MEEQKQEERMTEYRKRIYAFIEDELGGKIRGDNHQKLKNLLVAYADAKAAFYKRQVDEMVKSRQAVKHQQLLWKQTRGIRRNSPQKTK